MNLLEYQGKQLLAESGVAVPEGRLVGTPDDAGGAGRGLGPSVVVKAQVKAGGRGKAGGVLFATGSKAATETAARHGVRRGG
ncbi:MAG: hypothetical protein M3164_06005 [Actinomycetota bacterium]|nr:hypothetical protein [Actinomycetota bacterium]